MSLEAADTAPSRSLFLFLSPPLERAAFILGVVAILGSAAQTTNANIINHQTSTVPKCLLSFNFQLKIESAAEKQPAVANGQL